MEKMDKKAIAPTLRRMSVGEEERFPLEQQRSVCNTIYANLVVERAKGMKWSCRTDMVNQMVIVTRVS